jgi:hypothetical protein
MFPIPKSTTKGPIRAAISREDGLESLKKKTPRIGAFSFKDAELPVQRL